MTKLHDANNDGIYSAQEQATAEQQRQAMMGANYFTWGLAGPFEEWARKQWPGTGNRFDRWDQKYNPTNKQNATKYKDISVEDYERQQAALKEQNKTSDKNKWQNTAIDLAGAAALAYFAGVEPSQGYSMTQAARQTYQGQNGNQSGSYNEAGMIAGGFDSGGMFNSGGAGSGQQSGGTNWGELAQIGMGLMGGMNTGNRQSARQQSAPQASTGNRSGYAKFGFSPGAIAGGGGSSDMGGGDLGGGGFSGGDSFGGGGMDFGGFGGGGGDTGGGFEGNPSDFDTSGIGSSAELFGGGQQSGTGNGQGNTMFGLSMGDWGSIINAGMGIFGQVQRQNAEEMTREERERNRQDSRYDNRLEQEQERIRRETLIDYINSVYSDYGISVPERRDYPSMVSDFDAGYGYNPYPSDFTRTPQTTEAPSATRSPESQIQPGTEEDRQRIIESIDNAKMASSESFGGGEGYRPRVAAKLVDSDENAELQEPPVSKAVNMEGTEINTTQQQAAPNRFAFSDPKYNALDRIMGYMEQNRNGKK